MSNIANIYKVEDFQQYLDKLITITIEKKSFEEAQAARLNCNYEALQIFEKAALNGWQQNPQVKEKLKKLWGQQKNSRVFQNNHWMRNALEILLPSPLSKEQPSQEQAAKKIEELTQNFYEKCYDPAKKTFRSYRYNARVDGLKKLSVSLFARIKSLVAIVLAFFVQHLFKQNEKAMQILNYALAQNQTSVKAREMLGRLYLDQKNYGQAYAKLNEAVAFNPNLLKAQQLLLETYSNQGLWNEAVTHFLEACLRTPNNNILEEALQKAQAQRLFLFYLDIENAFGEPDLNKALDYVLELAQTEFNFSNATLEELRGTYLKEFTQDCYPTATAKRYLFIFTLSMSNIDPGIYKIHFAMLNAEKEIGRQAHLQKFVGSSLSFSIPFLYTYLEALKKDYPLEPFLQKFIHAWNQEVDLTLSVMQLKLFREAAIKKSNADLKAEIEEWFAKVISTHATNKVAEIQKLASGEECQQLFGWTVKNEAAGHALFFIIRKQENGKYTFQVVNTGSEIERHQKQMTQMKVKYKPDFCIEDVDCGKLENLELWKELFYVSSMEKTLPSFYDFIISRLGGRIVQKPIGHPDKELITPQQSGSCSWSLLLAVLRLYLPYEGYKKFISQMKGKSIEDFEKRFENQLWWDKEARELLALAQKKYRAKHLPRQARAA